MRYQTAPCPDSTTNAPAGPRMIRARPRQRQTSKNVVDLTVTRLIPFAGIFQRTGCSVRKRKENMDKKTRLASIAALAAVVQLAAVSASAQPAPQQPATPPTTGSETGAAGSTAGGTAGGTASL